jgi:hypothetical protein
MRPTRGDSIRLDNLACYILATPTRLISYEVRVGMREKLNMSFLELRAALQSGLDHALVEFGEADLEEFQIGQRR